MRFLTSCICFIALVFTLHTPLQTDDMTAAVVAAVGGDTTGMTALESASTGGMPRLSRALARLESHRRLLMLAAHPDDEDTRALAWLAQTGGEAAYLSLNRGEGGQNLIGDELGVGLGLIRSRELLAARQVDGARQYFSRAYDFGFTRSLDETLTRWSREVLIEDSVRVIRRFKPQVLVSVFPPDERAGHGHHQAAGVLAAEVIEAAADPTLFPELGPAWRVTTLFRSAWWDPSAATVRFSLGTLDRFNGRSIMQTALASRSQHRSQDMGLVQPLGHATGALIWESGGDGTPSTELFTGVDTELEAIAALLPEGETRDAVAAHLFDIASRAGLTRWSVLTLTPQEAASAVAQIVQALDEAISIVSGIESDGAIHARQLLVEKRSIAVEALATAAGIAADAWTDREEVVAGAELEVQAELWSSAGVEVGEVRIEPRGWPLVSSTEREAEGRRFRTEVTAARTLVVQVPADAKPSVPYFLENPLDGDLFDWT
ncbi:MAG: PIG-L family deacetylase, partial [Acidobacteriota bacterium]